VAVASFTKSGALQAPRNFGPPKRPTLKAWYREATKQIPDAPKWDHGFEHYATVSETAIVFDAPSWSLFISRGQYLRS
jgi:hypothetical protein